MTNYERGAQKERDLQKLFVDDNDSMNEDAFAIETIRSAGSKGTFDVAILTPIGVRFIQVKKIEKGNDWHSDYDTEVERIKGLPRVGDNVSYEYWVWENYNGWIYREVIE